MFGIGAGEFIVIIIVGLIVFGPSKLPEVGRALGKALREFRKAQAALTATLTEEEPVKTVKADEIKNPYVNRQPTVEEVINLAKERSPVKENGNEKNFNDSGGTATDDGGGSDAGKRGGANGVDKQP